MTNRKNAKKTPTKPKPLAGTELVFKSKIVNWAKGMDYCAIPVPATITQKLGTKAAVLVMARVNGSKPFKVSLFPAGEGTHFIRIRKKVRTEANLQEGDLVQVRFVVLDRDADAQIPPDLQKALRAEDVLADFKSISAGTRNYLIRRINDAARAETRKKRIEEAVTAAHEKREKQERPSFKSCS